MKFAFHIWGDRIDEFVKIAPVPKTLFYRPVDTPPISPKGDIGVYLEPKEEIPSWTTMGAQYTNNYDSVPEGFRYVVYYGDVTKIQKDKRIPIVCDIMDENFWYYWKHLQSFGLFTFSVNSTLCDSDVFRSTIKSLRSLADPVKYGGLF